MKSVEKIHAFRPCEDRKKACERKRGHYEEKEDRRVAAVRSAGAGTAARHSVGRSA